MQASAEVPMGEAPKGFENELGATAPLGFWDPLGLSTRASPETFRRWRATELKHGRIAMMATVGYIVQEFMRWPGYLSTSAGVKFEDLPNGIGAWAAMPDAGKFQVVFGILLMEGVTWPYYDGGGPLWAPGRKVKEGKEPGDVAGDVWVRYTDPEVRANKLNIELNNGRAAMLGITGMLMHDHITGSWIPPGL
jgi:light-harvesting complex I chlorophyll a/b binding protein 1